MKYKTSFKNGGGEYCYGFVTNENEIQSLNEMIENGDEINITNSVYFNDEPLEHNYYDYDQILHIYGPVVDKYLKINIFKIEDENEIDYLKKCKQNQIKFFSLGNPYFERENFQELNDNSLIFGGYYIEKNLEISFELNTNEEFTFNNLFIGLVNLDETLCGDEVISKAYYLDENNQNEILKLYNIAISDININEKQDYVKDAISDLLYILKDKDDENYNNALLLKEIIDANELSIIGDIEGQGFHKYEYVVIKNMENDELYSNEN